MRLSKHHHQEEPPDNIQERRNPKKAHMLQMGHKKSKLGGNVAKGL
jgi:hypothetical protein